MRRIKTLAIVAGLAILVAACSNPAASTAPSSAAPPPASSAPVSEAPSSAAPTAMKVGYISLGE